MAALFGLCGLLLALQYRWTGALSRAELASLQASLRARPFETAERFNSELQQLCVSLLPTASELDSRGTEAAHASRLSDWMASETRRPFERIAVVVPQREELAIRELNQRDGALRAIAWPEAWTALHDQMLGRWKRETGPPSVPLDSWLVELPVFDSTQREREWMVFELDDAYLRETWFPELLMDTFGTQPVRAELSSRSAATTVLAWPASSPRPARAADAAADVFPRSVTRRSRGGGDGRWLLEVWYGPRPLEATVAVTRARNLAVASVLVALIAATAWARTRVAARARHLAARELAFLAGVSHELRTPLAAIRGAGHNLRASVVTDPEKQRAYGALIVERADQLTGMVEQLISLASLRRSTHPATPARLSIAALVDEAVRSTADVAAAAGCRVEVDVPAALPPVLGDGAAIRRAFENLLANALTHGAAGGWVGVTARTVMQSGSPAVEVAVADRGPGIPERERALIWEPFVQGATHGGPTRRGFGLGLSLVREIVVRHGGVVSLEGGEGAGATFIVRFPVAAGEA